MYVCMYVCEGFLGVYLLNPAKMPFNVRLFIFFLPKPSTVGGNSKRCTPLNLTRRGCSIWCTVRLAAYSLHTLPAFS